MIFELLFGYLRATEPAYAQWWEKPVYIAGDGGGD